MKQVRTYECKDGKLFTDRAQAEQHELMVNIRGILQRAGRGGTVDVSDVSKTLVNNVDTVYDTIMKYKRTMAGLKGAKTKNSKALV